MKYQRTLFVDAKEIEIIERGIALLEKEALNGLAAEGHYIGRNRNWVSKITSMKLVFEKMKNEPKRTISEATVRRPSDHN